MKKHLLFLTIFCALISGINAQTNVFFDDFENYDTDKLLKKIQPDDGLAKYKAQNIIAKIAEGEGANGSSKYVNVTPDTARLNKIVYIKAYPKLDNLTKGKDYQMKVFVKNTHIQLYEQMLITFSSTKKLRLNSDTCENLSSWTEIATEKFYYHPDSTVTDFVMIIKSLDSTNRDLHFLIDDLQLVETDHQPMAPRFYNISDKVIGSDSTSHFRLRAFDQDSKASDLTFALTGDVPAFMTLSGDTVIMNPTVDDVGEYTVSAKVTDETGLYDSTSFRLTVENATAIPSRTITRISLRPNPSSNGIFRVQSDEIISGYRVYDLTGRLITRRDQLADRLVTINLTGQPRGLYLIKVVDNRGRTRTLKAIIH